MSLADGTVLPSFLDTRSSALPRARDIDQNDLRLRVGRIVASHAPDASSNSNGTVYEYDVEVDIGAGVTKVYPRAVMSDPLGGLADTLFYKPRLSTGGNDLNKLDTGTRVLLLCVNGQSGRSLIIGGTKHHGKKAKESVVDGVFRAEVNGIILHINEDGELKVTHKGATNDDGTVKTDGATTNGTFIQLDKNGDVKIGTGSSSSTLIHMESSGQVMNLNATSNVKIQSSGVMTGAATDSTLMGSTYRRDKTVMHSTMMPLLTALSALASTAGTGFTTAAAQLQAAGVAQKVPVAGAVAASVPIQAASVACMTAAAAVTAMGPLFTQLMAAIQIFESKAATHLSLKNKSD